MTHKVPERVAETCNVVGSGNITPTGAIDGYQTFGSQLAAADTVDYLVERVDDKGKSTGPWEAGIGTWNGTALVRRFVFSSTGSTVNFGAGSFRVSALWLGDVMPKKQAINAGSAPYLLTDTDPAAKQTAALSAAIDDAVTQKRDLVIPAGNYTTNAKIIKSIPDKQSFTLTGLGNVNIDCTTAGETPFLFCGVLGTEVGLGANAAAGDCMINVGTLSVIAGDMIKIVSTDLWNPTREYYVKGELAIVVSIAAGIATLAGPLFDGYLAATTTVAKVSAPYVKVENIAFTGAGKQALLTLRHCRSAIMDRVKAFGTRYVGGYVDESISGSANDCYMDCPNWSSGEGLNYGFGLGSTQNFTVNGGYFNGGRHGISTGGTFPCRNLVFRGMTVSGGQTGSKQPGCDTHGNTQNVLFDACLILHGLIIASTETVVQNCKICGDASSNIAIRWYPELPSSLQIHNCDIDVGANGRGIYVRFQSNAPALALRKLEVTGTKITSPYVGIYIDPNGVRGYSFKSLVLRDNEIYAGQYGFFSPDGETAPVWNDVLVDGGYIRTTGDGDAIRIYSSVGGGNAMIRDLFIDGNKRGRGVRGFANFRNVTLEGGRFKGGDEHLFANNETVIIDNHHLDGTSKGFVLIAPTKRIMLNGNIDTSLAEAALIRVPATAHVVDNRKVVRSVIAATTLFLNCIHLTNNTGAVTCALPVSPRNGDWVELLRGNSWAANVITLNRNGQTIEGVAADDVLNVDTAMRRVYVFNGTTWRRIIG